MNNRKTQADIISLIRKVRGGDELAFSELLRLYDPLLSSTVSRYGTPAEAEDLAQDVRLVFYNAVMKYDLEQNEVEFGFFAKVCLRNAMVSYLRERDRAVVTLPLDEASGLHSPDDPGSEFIENESAQILQRLIDESLSEYERRVWQLHFEGNTPKSIAAILGRDTKSICNALCRIRAKLKAAVSGQNN